MEMKIIRKIDRLGRIVIPKDIRYALGLNFNDKIELAVKNGCLIVEKKKASIDVFERNSV